MTTKQKQWQLYFLGYYGGQIDGIFGAKSKAATEAFQKDNDLDVDGIFGPKTEDKSIEVVKGIQEALGATADGLAGPKTVVATVTFQKSKGLSADGIAGPKTRAKIAENEPVNWDAVKHFKRNEFKCKCGGKHCNGFPVEPKKKLVTVLDRMREHFDKPTNVNSGVRCAAHNKNVGGVSNSRHMSGRAADIKITGKTSAEILEYAKAQPEVRYAYAINSKSVHVDVY